MMVQKQFHEYCYDSKYTNYIRITKYTHTRAEEAAVATSTSWWCCKPFWRPDIPEVVLNSERSYTGIYLSKVYFDWLLSLLNSNISAAYTKRHYIFRHIAHVGDAWYCYRYATWIHRHDKANCLSNKKTSSHSENRAFCCICEFMILSPLVDYKCTRASYCSNFAAC